MSVMNACGVVSTKVTHSGRHAGTTEAYNLGLNLEDIRHLGRRVMGQMENFYAPKSPIKEECNREMLGVNPNEVTEADVFWTSLGETASKIFTTLINSSLIDRIRFLKLTHEVLTSSLIERLPEIFKSQMFTDFQKQLLEAISAHQ
ncbi:hypothetical protein BGW38_010632 [Lunasporangiospora selenospora]|uniref:Uncharacterized protein n=1 Tax=Lunasporangiospora selenospora TaxID=979761 RepID=A0A9P6FW81_9FUNG|nr:hypothetical protein BGW38_010632 [Lunasporangiospora selenospora]